jgi:hypothetical protein
VVDTEKLRNAIQAELNQRRAELRLPVAVTELHLEDGIYFVNVAPVSDDWRDGYAEVLSDVESAILDRYAVNIQLIPLNPEPSKAEADAE